MSTPAQYREPFDPGDPFDAMAHEFNNQVTALALRANEAAIYRDLDSIRQLECFVSGVLTGLIGVCFASIETSGRDAMMDWIKDCLPACRENVESMVEK